MHCNLQVWRKCRLDILGPIAGQAYFVSGAISDIFTQLMEFVCVATNGVRCKQVIMLEVLNVLASVWLH